MNTLFTLKQFQTWKVKKCLIFLAPLHSFTLKFTVRLQTLQCKPFLYAQLFAYSTRELSETMQSLQLLLGPMCWNSSGFIANNSVKASYLLDQESSVRCSKWFVWTALIQKRWSDNRAAYVILEEEDFRRMQVPFGLLAFGGSRNEIKINKLDDRSDVCRLRIPLERSL